MAIMTVGDGSVGASISRCTRYVKGGSSGGMLASTAYSYKVGRQQHVSECKDNATRKAHVASAHLEQMGD